MFVDEQCYILGGLDKWYCYCCVVSAMPLCMIELKALLLRASMESEQTLHFPRICSGTESI